MGVPGSAERANLRRLGVVVVRDPLERARRADDLFRATPRVLSAGTDEAVVEDELEDVASWEGSTVGGRDPATSSK